MAQALLLLNVTPGAPTTTTPLPLYDPVRVHADRARLRWDSPPELAYANSLYCPSGRWPSRAWILLRRGDYNQIANLYRTDFQLQIDDFVNGTLTFKGLAIVQARCVTRGSAADPDAIYLVELTDAQGVVANVWSDWPVSSQYNVVAPAYPGKYYTGSTPGGGDTPWTWDGMVGDLWGQMPPLGAYPHLPITPAGTPENFAFPGESCWDALNRVLSLLGLTTSSDLLQTSPYPIVVPGAAEPAFAALVAKYAGALEEDYEYIDAGAGRVPGQVTVYFHRANQYYGTEETVRRDSLQWQTSSVYSVTINAPATYAGSPGKATVWDDFAVRYDINGSPLAADVTTANAIAQERVSQYFTKITRGTAGYLRQVYTGALPFFAGATVDGVRWFQVRENGRAAWRTELVRGPQPPWDAVGVPVFEHR